MENLSTWKVDVAVGGAVYMALYGDRAGYEGVYVFRAVYDALYGALYGAVHAAISRRGEPPHPGLELYLGVVI